MSPEPPIRVIVVEDQALFRSMLAELIRQEDGFELVGSADSIAQARAVLASRPADVLLLDVELPDGNGFAFGRAVRDTHAGIGVVLLSGHDVMDLLLAVPAGERAGWSYLSKVSSTSRATLLRAVRASARGESVLDPALLDRLTPRRGSPLAALTPRQLHALRLLAEGLSNTAIAKAMGISPHSVDNLLSAMYTVLGVRDDGDVNSRVAAALHLVRDGALEPGPR
jgi:DNA-binding NarL/FixJ family response regulator